MTGRSPKCCPIFFSEPGAGNRAPRRRSKRKAEQCRGRRGRLGHAARSAGTSSVFKNGHDASETHPNCLNAPSDNDKAGPIKDGERSEGWEHYVIPPDDQCRPCAEMEDHHPPWF